MVIYRRTCGEIVHDIYGQFWGNCPSRADGSSLQAMEYPCSIAFCTCMVVFQTENSKGCFAILYRVSMKYRVQSIALDDSSSLKYLGSADSKDCSASPSCAVLFWFFRLFRLFWPCFLSIVYRIHFLAIGTWVLGYLGTWVLGYLEFSAPAF